MSGHPMVETVTALADDLRAAGVEVGYVGGEPFRQAVAQRLVAAGWSRPSGGVDGDHLTDRGFLTDNALCVAADERADVYQKAGVDDADLAKADAAFLADVERIVAAHVAAAVEQARADTWDEALQAVAWCLDNGEESAAAALAYVMRNNPHRAALADPEAGVRR